MTTTECNPDNRTNSPGFLALLTTEFMSAFNDNIYQQSLKLIVIASAVQYGDAGSAVLLGLVFSAPFILFSGYAGEIADRFSKTRVMQFAKAMELIVMLLGAYALVEHRIWWLIGVLFLTAMKSTLFSPAKYSIIPEILANEEISKGNGYLECWTFAAIIFGTAVGGYLVNWGAGPIPAPALAITAVAFIGFAASIFLPPTKAARSDLRFQLNPFHALAKLKTISQNKPLFLAILGVCFFWFVGVICSFNLLLYGQVLNGWSETSSTLLATALGLGIGIGSLASGIVSEGKVELGLVPIGALGITVTGLIGLNPHLGLAIAMLNFGLLGFFGGVFYVPLNSYIQRNSPPESRGTYIGTTNMLSFMAMALASLLHYIALSWLHLNPAHIFGILGCATIGVTIYACRLMPELILRAINWIFAHSIYKLQTKHAYNLPNSGGALLVCNHVSYADACLLLAASERPIRFLMYKPIYEHRWIHPFAKIARAIPIAPESNPKEILRSIVAAREAIKAGELVCIFAEGSLTRLGNLLPFTRGFEKIMKGLDAPIIPVHLDQLWGSIFSYHSGRFFWKIPRSLPYPVTISFGPHLAANTPAYKVRRAVWELSSQAFSYREKCYQLLHAAFLQSAKGHLLEPCISDTTGQRMTYYRTLVTSLLLASRLKVTCPAEKMLGVFLPSSCGAVLANLATLFAGMVPVNLNFTAGEENLRSAADQCEMNSLITSRAFVEKFQPPTGPRILYLEDIAAQIRPSDKVWWALLVLVSPLRLLERILIKRGASEKDLATIIFSSGSSGEPKGVMLSHRNINSNLHALYDLFQLTKQDCVVGVLPFFHSFGFTATLWLPLLASIRAAYHPNPLDGEAIGKLVKEEQGTLIMGTPTFLLTYARRCTKEQFASLRIVVVGAEKLHERIAKLFENKFGIEPLEGYGTTELSPVASLNIPNYEVNGMHQTGHKPGTVGHPIPGIAVKVVDPDTLKELEPHEEGLLLIRGENVMLGYLRHPEKTNEVILDGWYVTGDIAKIDEDGFISIVGRISRFSKIAGEMIPHGKVEEEILQALEQTEQVIVVTAIPDANKGEKLIVLHTIDLDPKTAIEKLQKRNLPNLWIPKPDAFHRVEALPLLGSGKLDLAGIKRMAKEIAGGEKEG